jgi:hypothetical protein
MVAGCPTCVCRMGVGDEITFCNVVNLFVVFFGVFVARLTCWFQS